MNDPPPNCLPGEPRIRSGAGAEALFNYFRDTGFRRHDGLSKLLKKLVSPWLLKKVQMQGGMRRAE